MSFIARAFPVILLHDLVKVSCCIFASFVLKFLKKWCELFLNFSCLLFKLSRTITKSWSQRDVLLCSFFNMISRDILLFLMLVNLDWALSWGSEHPFLLLRNLNIIKCRPLLNSRCAWLLLGICACWFESATKTRWRNSLSQVFLLFSWLSGRYSFSWCLFLLFWDRFL
jgi:hypothetical protein